MTEKDNVIQFRPSKKNTSKSPPTAVDCTEPGEDFRLITEQSAEEQAQEQIDLSQQQEALALVTTALSLGTRLVSTLIDS